MNEIFHKLIVQEKITIYIDNIVIPHFTKNPFERNQIINQVLDICQVHDLYLKGEKCEFFKKSIEVLGFIITEQGIQIDPKKIEAIISWPTSTKVKEVQQFLGHANYHRRFIQEFSRIAHPLHKLLGKEEDKP